MPSDDSKKKFWNICNPLCKYLSVIRTQSRKEEVNAIVF